MNDKYTEIMNLILSYGQIKLEIGKLIMSDSYKFDKFDELDDKKTITLDQICDAIIELTK